MINHQNFIKLCSTRNLQDIQSLLEKLPKIHIHAISTAFNNACKNGHLDVAQLLYQFYPKIDVLTDPKNNVFIDSTVYSIIEIIEENCFESACKNGHLDVALWLYSLNPFRYYIKIENNKIDKWYIKNTHDEYLSFIIYALNYNGDFQLSFNFVENISEYLRS